MNLLFSEIYKTELQLWTVTRVNFSDVIQGGKE